MRCNCLDGGVQWFDRRGSPCSLCVNFLINRQSITSSKDKKRTRWTKDKRLTHHRDPCSIYLAYPSFRIKASSTSAVPSSPKSASGDASLKPNPGMLGHMTWKALSALLIGVGVDTGSHSPSITLAASKKPPPQSWQMSRGTASLNEDLRCTKCRFVTFLASVVVVVLAEAVVGLLVLLSSERLVRY